MKLPKVTDQVLYVAAHVGEKDKLQILHRWPMIVSKVRMDGMINGYVTPNSPAPNGHRPPQVPAPFDLTNLPFRDSVKPSRANGQTSWSWWEFVPATPAAPETQNASEPAAAGKSELTDKK